MLNIEADFGGNNMVSHSVNVTLLFYTFALDDKETFPACRKAVSLGVVEAWAYCSSLKRSSTDSSGVCNKLSLSLSLFIWSFRSSDDAKHAKVVQWNYGMDT